MFQAPDCLHYDVVTAYQPNDSDRVGAYLLLSKSTSSKFTKSPVQVDKNTAYNVPKQAISSEKNHFGGGLVFSLNPSRWWGTPTPVPVSYTHLTLPTILRV